jgi:hypothetical protein
MRIGNRRPAPTVTPVSDSELLKIISRTTTSYAGQQAAARTPELQAYAAENPHLAEDLWDELSGRTGTKRASIDMLKTLMLHPRTPTQIDWLMNDPRVKIGAWLAHTQTLTTTELQTLLTRWPNSPEIGWAVGKDQNTTPEMLESITSISDESMLKILGARQDCSELLTTVLLRSRRDFIAYDIVIYELLHANPQSIDALLDAVVDPAQSTWTSSARNLMALELSQSAHLPADGWAKIRDAHGGPHTAAVIGAYGNPNTSHAGVAWCENHLAATLKPGTVPAKRVAEITRLRSTGLTPVTGTWTSTLPADQRHTVDTLALAGLATEHDWHIRKPQKTPKLTKRMKPKVKTASIGQLPTAPTFDDWQLLVGWRTAIATKGAKWADQALGEDPAAWQTFITLADGWAGTLDELANASRSLGRKSQQPAGRPIALATAAPARPGRTGAQISR